ncbi:MAG: hypothetical protein ACP5G0_05070 [Desulfomonilia bacterium]
METIDRTARIDTVLEIQRLERQSINLLSSLITEFMQSPTLCNVVFSVFRNVLVAWSDGNWYRQKISEIALRMANERTSFQTPSSGGSDARNVGQLITVLAQHLNALQKQNPMYVADRLEGPLSEVIAHTDFGELKECLDRAEEPVVELFRRVMEFIWSTYPAKFGTIITMIHPVANIVVRSVQEVLKPLTAVSPDLFTDLIFAIAGSIDGRRIGELANTVMEMARQIHTGSLLQGEAGVPQFQVDLTEKLREIMSSMDAELLAKVKVITAEMAEERENALSDILDEHPELTLDLISRMHSLTNPHIRARHRRIGVFANLPEEEFAAACEGGLREIDCQEIGQLFNTLVGMFNTVHEKKPDFFPCLLTDFFVTIDTDVLKEAVAWILRDMNEGLKPIADEVMPVLLDGLRELYRHDEAS